MSTKNIQTLIRLPADVKERLEKEARANGRSMSSEIIVLLRRAYQMPEAGCKVRVNGR